MNVVVLQGTLSSEPIERTLPSGLNIMNWDVATIIDGRKLTVPVQWNNPPKKALAIVEGDAVVLFGTVRRRFYQAGGATLARTEVVAQQVAKPTQRVGVAKLLAEAHGQIDAAAA